MRGGAARMNSGSPQHPLGTNGRRAGGQEPSHQQSHTPRQAARERAQHAAGAHARQLCDEIDRSQQALLRLGDQLQGAAAICRELFDDTCRQQEHDTLERAERILRQLRQRK